ncbi:MAG: discoidin domain-containing protein [Clostridia bacterium]|nr:discoidin domain-containing protein [Clostridia bacterium]
MKYAIRILLLGLSVCLLCLLGACTGPSGDVETDTDTSVPSETPTAPDEIPTEAPTEAPTEPETEDPNLIPGVPGDEIGIGNVAPEGYAMAGSTKTGTNVLLNDGDPATGFVSREFGSTTVDTYVFIDLGRQYALHSVVLLPMTGKEAAFPQAFDVQVSDDFEVWKTVGKVEFGSDPDASGITVDIDGASGTYVRLAVTKLSDKQKTYAIGEMQVMAHIDRTNNLVMKQEDLWLYIDTPASLARGRLRVENTAADAPLRFMTADPSIVTVDHETGLMTPVGYGDTLVYAYDGTNLTACRVKVIDERETNVRISTFYHSSFGNPQPIPQCLDYMKEAGIEFLEETRAYDAVGNQVCDWMMHLCAERGIFYSVCDPLNSGDLAKADDKAVIALVQKYENRAGFGGIYLTDEPHEESNDYARVARVISAYNPHVTPHLNMLPIGGFPSWDEYISDYCAVAGGISRMEYLSYDNYCFLANGGFNSGVYDSLNRIRKYGLKYNAATGYYMQCMEIKGSYRISSDTELLMNASMGITYGMKNFKWFVYLTPIGSGEAFTTGMISADFTPSVMYEGVKAANARIREVGRVLGGADAVEVYHSNATNGNEVVPSDFVITQTTKNEAIYSLYQSLTDDQQYVVIVNRKFSANGDREFTFRAAADVESLEILSDGVFVPVDVNADNEFIMLIPAGDCIVLKLPAGYDARRPVGQPAANLALDRAAFVSSSQYTFWSSSKQAAWRLTDGQTEAGCWMAGNDDKTPAITVDLGKVSAVSRVMLYASDKRFPKSFVIEVSADGSTWTKVYEEEGVTLKSGEACTADFDTVDARFVRISCTQRTAKIAEIEIYE